MIDIREGNRLKPATQNNYNSNSVIQTTKMDQALNGLPGEPSRSSAVIDQLEKPQKYRLGIFTQKNKSEAIFEV